MKLTWSQPGPTSKGAGEDRGVSVTQFAPDIRDSEARICEQRDRSLLPKIFDQARERQSLLRQVRSHLDIG